MTIIKHQDTIFITFSKRLPDYTNWDVLDCFRRNMSWGPATVYIHRKRTDPSD